MIELLTEEGQKMLLWGLLATYWMQRLRHCKPGIVGAIVFITSKKAV